jgi:CheY-like chemotaxis protein
MTMTAEPLVMSVDDEGGILRLIDAELSSQGFRVISATNGEEALRIAEEQRPDIAVLDIMMPGLSGLEVMRKLRERGTMPIIIVSAKNTNMDKVPAEARTTTSPALRPGRLSAASAPAAAPSRPAQDFERGQVRQRRLTSTGACAQERRRQAHTH